MSLPRFGVTKPVPVNLVMMAVLIAGAFAALTLQREFFPEAPPDTARVVLRYPGATPEEVEQALAIKVEDRIFNDVDEVRELVTTVSEGGGGIVVRFREGLRNFDRALDKVERAVDALTDLPDDAERIQVVEFEPRLPVIMVTLYGDADEDAMKRAMRKIEDDLRSLPDMGEIMLSGLRRYEVRVDVDAHGLYMHGLSLPQVADSIRQWMMDIPGGSVRTDMGNISVRTMGTPERAEAIREIIVRADTEGRALRVRDIADVRKDFVDEAIYTRFNGQRSMSLTVSKVGQQDAVRMAETVRAYVQGRRGEPLEPNTLERLAGVVAAATGRADQRSGFRSHRQIAWDLGRSRVEQLPGEIAVHTDLARFIEGRLDLLLRNAIYGAMLVFLVLLVFLNWRVAFWVGIGLTTALAGTIVLMSAANITLNLLTMFGLIVVLGLLVDDAIVVAENIQSRHDRGEPALVSAIKGTEQVFWPVVATILTSIVAFLPLMFIEGRIGVLMGALPLVVMCALFMSLVESVLILPSHMGHTLAKRDKQDPGRVSRWIRGYEQARDRVVLNGIVPAFGNLLRRAITYRYITVSLVLSILFATLGLFTSGRVGYEFLASTDSETIIVDVRMPIGTPLARTNQIVERIEQAANAQMETRSISSLVGVRGDIETGTATALATHIAQMYIELEPVENRDRESSLVIDSIRRHLGPMDEVERLSFSEITGGPGGPDITFQVRGNDENAMMDAVADIKQMLAGFAGVYDITDDNTLGQREMQVEVTPAGAALNFTTADIARQIRGAVFGIDAHTFAAHREDIDVRVRLAEVARRDLHLLENLWVVSPAGHTVPLREIAEIVEGASYSTIRRIDRMRAITVTADTSPAVSPEDIVGDIDMDALRASNPNVVIDYGGRQRQQMEAFASLPYGFLAALLMIYLILAWLFGSYTQPIAVMLAIPFGVIGVIWGHFIMGYTLTFLSIIGFVALSGVVVNGSLILVKFYNSLREEGMTVRDGLVYAGMRRFRPIFLTTITTVCALTPLMLERSFQAKFLIPMAISISFGLMAATMVILIVLPCVLVIADDIKAVVHYLWHGRPRPSLGAPQPEVVLEKLPD